MQDLHVFHLCLKIKLVVVHKCSRLQLCLCNYVLALPCATLLIISCETSNPNQDCHCNLAALCYLLKASSYQCSLHWVCVGACGSCLGWISHGNISALLGSLNHDMLLLCWNIYHSTFIGKLHLLFLVDTSEQYYSFFVSFFKAITLGTCCWKFYLSDMYKSFAWIDMWNFYWGIHSWSLYIYIILMGRLICGRL